MKCAVRAFFLIFVLLSQTGNEIGRAQGANESPIKWGSVEYSFSDSSSIKVSYPISPVGIQNHTNQAYAKEVLDSAVFAYQTISHFQGFSAKGYSFSQPDVQYAFDGDRVIDILLVDSEDTRFEKDPLSGRFSVKDAPCFDTHKVSDTQYEATIILPLDYGQFIQNWEKLNLSPLGQRQASVDLRGTLIHEMLHVILFYYNKNMDRVCYHQKIAASKDPVKVDWYVEGLARYFETLAGARHDFFSQGFKETLPDKIRFSRGGSNFLMRFPDQDFTDLRYENALFWRFIDYHKGMNHIELLSRHMRDWGRENFQEALSKSIGWSIPELLQKYSMAVLDKDFGLKDDHSHLKDVARTKLLIKKNGFYLLDGYGQEEHLGFTCQTDWVGQWDDKKVFLSEESVAGDHTMESDVSGWATDYYEISLDTVLRKAPSLTFRLDDGDCSVSIQVVVKTRAGSQICKNLPLMTPQKNTQNLSLHPWIKSEGLDIVDVKQIMVLVTNMDIKTTAWYSIDCQI